MTGTSRNSSRAVRALLVAIVICAVSLGLPLSGPPSALAYCGDCVDCCLDTSMQCGFTCHALYGAGTPQGDACELICMERQYRCLMRCEV